MLLAVATARRVDAQTAAPSLPPARTTIDTIIIVNRNIFDLQEDASSFLARLANRLHVRTHAGIIRRTLLVNPGEPYDSARIAESERALRNLHVFSQVRIDTTRLDGRLALRVATTDGWSTKPQLGYTSAGGDVTWLAGVVEDNLLGTATQLVAVYNHTPDRNIFNLGYASPHFFSRRTQLQLSYNGKSDGKEGTWFLGAPFYETAARHALATDGEAADERVLVFKDADTAAIVFRRALAVGVTAGWAPHATTRDFVRLSASGRWRREDFDSTDVDPFPRSVFGTVGAGLDVGHVRFQVLERFNSYARREDVDVSQLFHLGVWAAPRAWGYPDGAAGVGPEVSAQVAAPWAGGFATLRVAGNGVFTSGRPDSGQVSGAFTIASQDLAPHTVILHVEAARQRRPKFGEQFDLWNTRNGPRLWGIHQFSGTQMLWLAFEDRVLVADDAWGLMGIGVAPFVDYGGAWYAGVEPARLGGDVGLSLRIGPTRAVRGDVAEIAFGYRFWRNGFVRPPGRWGLTIRKGVAY